MWYPIDLNITIILSFISRKMIPIKILMRDKVICQKLASVSENQNFIEISQQILDKQVEIQKVLVDQKDQTTGKIESWEISPTKTISETKIAIGEYFSKVTCYLKEDEVPESQPINAFDKLMNRRAVLMFPEVKEPERDGRDFIHNSIVQLLRDENCGFSSEFKSEMDFFMFVMVSTLWTLDGQTQKFVSASKVRKIPDKWIFKHPERDTVRAISHGGAIKKKIPPLTQEKLLECSENLDKLLAKNSLRKRGFQTITKLVQDLNGAILDYVAHLQDANEHTHESIQSETDPRTLMKINGSKCIPPFVKSTYSVLENKLYATDPFTPVNLVYFAPLERRAKYNYIRKLQFGFDVFVYRSIKPRVNFIWRVPEADDRFDLKNAQTVKGIEDNIENIAKSDLHFVVEKRFGSIVQYQSSDVDNIISLIDG